MAGEGDWRAVERLDGFGAAKGARHERRSGIAGLGCNRRFTSNPTANELQGKTLSIGAQAILLHAPNDLLSGLPQDDQGAILAAVGQTGTVADIMKDGTVEFELQGIEDPRTIWIHPKHLVS